MAERCGNFLQEASLLHQRLNHYVVATERVDSVGMRRCSSVEEGEVVGAMQLY